jgi:hypothetical protein
MRKTAFIVFISCLLISFSCKKNDQSGVPDVSVDFNLYLSEPSNSALNSVGNWVYVSGHGIKGIIIYRQTLEIFTAYDRACPYDYNVSASHIDVDSVNTIFVDKNCGSKFNLLNGQVSEGPATNPMKQYAADYDGSNIVHVHN